MSESSAGLTALFYSPDLELGQLQQYAIGAFVPPGELLEFGDDTQTEAGREVQRELGVPYLDGMDEIVVEAARLELRSRPHEVEGDFSLSEPAGVPGIVISFERPVRLRRIHLSYAEPAESANPAERVHLVIRGAEPQGSGFAAGPPLFAHPSFPPPGDMYPAVLAGLGVSRSGDSRVVTLPRPFGSAWLVQVARATSAVDLAPLDLAPTVTRVEVDAAPTNLAVEMTTEAGPVALWSHPEMLLPDAGPQGVDFATLAQRELTSRLAAASAATVTLPVPLTFRSDTPATLEITSKQLTARYRSHPLAAEPLTLRLGGSRTPLSLSAAGLRPLSAAVDLTAKPLGRELNRASAEPPVALPSRGLLVTPERSVAAECRFAPLEEAPAEEQGLVAIRLWIEAAQESEAVLEVRLASGAVPGPALASQVVRVIEAGFSGWLEFELGEPLVLAAAETRLWIALRLNKGELRWFETPAAEAGPEPMAALLSFNEGASWGEPEAHLGTPQPLLTQLFQQSLEPQSPPVIRLHDGARLLAADLLAGASQNPSDGGALELVAAGASLPAPVLDLLASAAGPGRPTRELQLYSSTVLDLTLERVVLEYDPFQASAAGGES